MSFRKWCVNPKAPSCTDKDFGSSPGDRCTANSGHGPSSRCGSCYWGMTGLSWAMMENCKVLASQFGKYEIHLDRKSERMTNDVIINMFEYVGVILFSVENLVLIHCPSIDYLHRYSCSFSNVLTRSTCSQTH